MILEEGLFNVYVVIVVWVLCILLVGCILDVFELVCDGDDVFVDGIVGEVYIWLSWEIF